MPTASDLKPATDPVGLDLAVTATPRALWEWLEKQPDGRRFWMRDIQRCVLAAYVQETYADYRPVGGSGYYTYAWEHYDETEHRYRHCQVGYADPLPEFIHAAEIWCQKMRRTTITAKEARALLTELLPLTVADAAEKAAERGEVTP